jgi:hypothetical protein
VPEIQSHDGDWWWIGGTGLKQSRTNVVRLTSKGLREYSPNNCLRMSMSPKGTIWACQYNKYWRYSAKLDDFVEDEPWDEYAFQLGKWTLSYVPATELANSCDLYCKIDGKWASFYTPYSSSEPARVIKNAVYRGRLLVTVGAVGVLEYDAARGQWTRLVDTNSRAMYDYAGRRIISTGQCVLVYEGDTLANADAKSEDDAFQRLLKQLDDDSFKVREAATQQLAAEVGKYGLRIREAIANDALSLEVRERLKRVLPANDKGAPPPPPLLRTMHPLIAPAN